VFDPTSFALSDMVDCAAMLRREMAGADSFDDAANRAVVKLIAKRAGVARSRVRIVRGQRARRKLVAIEGAPDDVLERIRGRA